MSFPRRIFICLLFIVALAVIPNAAIMSANDGCTPCDSTKPPNGLFGTDLGPALYSGERIWSPQSLALVAESQLMDVTTWQLVTEAASAIGQKDITLSDIMTGRFILVKLYLHPVTSLITPEQVVLENSAGKKLPPKHIFVIQQRVEGAFSGLSSIYHAILVYEKEDVLATDITWLKLWLTTGKNSMYFSFRVRPTP